MYTGKIMTGDSDNVYSLQSDQLLAAVTSFNKTNGEKLVALVDQKSTLLVHWLNYIRASRLTGTGDDIVFAMIATLREVAANLAVGFMRPALFSLRGLVDCAFAWLYFKDHGIEWATLNDRKVGFKQKSEIIEYLKYHYPGFVSRLALLESNSGTSRGDVYGLLSAHIHAQSEHVFVDVTNLQDAVAPEDICLESVLLVEQVCEYVSDVMSAVFFNSWYSLPSEVKTSLDQRFISAAQKAEFFK
jgi:hypothetical protein